MQKLALILALVGLSAVARAASGPTFDPPGTFKLQAVVTPSLQATGGSIANVDTTGATVVYNGTTVSVGSIAALAEGAIAKALMGAPNGVATLDASGYVPVAQIPASIATAAQSASSAAFSALAKANAAVPTALGNVANGYAALGTGGLLSIAVLPAFSGDVSSLAGSSTLTLAPTGVVAGACVKPTLDSKGRATGCGTLAGTDLPIATPTTLGAVKVDGTTVIIAPDGTLSSVGGGSGSGTVDTMARNSAAAAQQTANAAVPQSSANAAGGYLKLDSNALAPLANLPTGGTSGLAVLSSGKLTDPVMPSDVTAAVTQAGAALQPSGNLAGLTNTMAARSSLGLGSAALLSAGGNGGAIVGDTNGRLPAAAFPALTGAVTTTAGSFSTTLAPTGVTAGAYPKVTVGADGRVTAGGTLTSADLPAATATGQGAMSLQTAGAQAPVQSASSGLAVASGVISPVYGTATNTVAQGNDSRITGAMQKANNLSDLPSASTARVNLGLGTAATVSTGNTSGTLALLGAGGVFSDSVMPADLAHLDSAGTLNSNLASPSVTGSVPRTVALRLADTINAADYGMKCDGTTDNANAWALIKTAYAIAPGSAEIDLPAGSACLSSVPVAITVAIPLTIAGRGPDTTILGVTGAGSDGLDFTLANASSLTLRGFTVAKETANNGSGLQARFQGQAIFVTGGASAGAGYGSATANGGQVTLEDIVVQGPTENTDATHGWAAGIHLQNVHTPHIEHTRVFNGPALASNTSGDNAYLAQLPVPGGTVTATPTALGPGIASDYWLEGTGGDGGADYSVDAVLYGNAASGGIAGYDFGNYIQGVKATDNEAAYSDYGVRAEGTGLNEALDWKGGLLNTDVASGYFNGYLESSIIGTRILHNVAGNSASGGAPWSGVWLRNEGNFEVSALDLVGRFSQSPVAETGIQIDNTNYPVDVHGGIVNGIAGPCINISSPTADATVTGVRVTYCATVPINRALDANGKSAAVLMGNKTDSAAGNVTDDGNGNLSIPGTAAFGGQVKVNGAVALQSGGAIVGYATPDANGGVDILSSVANRNAVLKVAPGLGAGVPACSSANDGAMMTVQDATSSVIGSTYASGGSVHGPIWCDTSGWKFGVPGTTSGSAGATPAATSTTPGTVPNLGGNSGAAATDSSGHLVAAELPLSALTTSSVFGLQAHTAATGVTAASITTPSSGAAPSGATQLAAARVQVTTCSASAPVQLPAGAPNGAIEIKVLNRSTGTCMVYPPSAGTIESNGANVPVGIATGQDVTFVSLSTSAWDE